MARLNNCILYGFIENRPQFTVDPETNEHLSGMVYLHVVRGYRDDHAGKKYMRHDFPLIISMDKEVLREMETWKENDIVMVKGVVTTTPIEKPSYCPNCKDENGRATENLARGILLYVTPIYASKAGECADKKEALSRVVDAREISNIVLCYGNLVRDPKYFKTITGTVITQYQVVMERKFRIRADSPDNRVDWPWVKSYGNQAIEDKLRLTKGSEVYIDGVLQARTVHRKTKCECCGEIYQWDDHTLEIVPYDVEYLNNYKTDEILEKEEGQTADERRQKLFDFLEKDHLEEDDLTERVDTNTVASISA